MPPRQAPSKAWYASASRRKFAIHQVQGVGAHDFSRARSLSTLPGRSPRACVANILPIRGMSEAEPRVFYGWWAALAAALRLFLNTATIVVFPFGIFAQAIIQEFHIGRATISLAFTFHNLAAAICVPLAGRLVDRYGPRRVLLPFTVLLSLILVSSRALSTARWQLYAAECPDRFDPWSFSGGRRCITARLARSCTALRPVGRPDPTAYHRWPVLKWHRRLIIAPVGRGRGLPGSAGALE